MKGEGMQEERCASPCSDSAVTRSQRPDPWRAGPMGDAAGLMKSDESSIAACQIKLQFIIIIIIFFNFLLTRAESLKASKSMLFAYTVLQHLKLFALIR